MEVLKWINDRLNINLDRNNLNSIRDFTLLWNLYETETCSTYYSKTKIKKFIKRKTFNKDDFEEVLQYFKDRYVNKNNTNNKFDHLQLRDNDNPQLVKDVLLGNNENIEDIVLVCSTIVYRYRCNLFHGTKNVATINHQKANFDNANKFMQKMLEVCFP